MRISAAIISGGGRLPPVWVAVGCSDQAAGSERHRVSSHQDPDAELSSLTVSRGHLGYPGYTLPPPLTRAATLTFLSVTILRGAEDQCDAWMEHKVARRPGAASRVSRTSGNELTWGISWLLARTLECLAPLCSISPPSRNWELNPKMQNSDPCWKPDSQKRRG